MLLSEENKVQPFDPEPFPCMFIIFFFIAGKVVADDSALHAGIIKLEA